MNGRSPALLPLLLTLVLGACDEPEPTVSPEEQAAAEQARREEVLRMAVEKERSDYQSNVGLAKRMLDGQPNVANLGAFDDAVMKYTKLSEAALVDLDYVTPAREVVLEGIGKQIYDQLLADWADKTKHTEELRSSIKQVAGFRINVLAISKVPPSEWIADASRMLAVGHPSETWVLGNPSHTSDRAVLKLMLRSGGTQADVHAACRAGLDLVLAEDKKNKPRQHYVLQTCVDVAGDDWQADLPQWATAKEVKAFRKIYDPVRVEVDKQKEADAAAKAERDAEHAAWLERKRAEEAAAGSSSSSSFSSGSSGSSSSSSTPTQGPVSVTLRNTCGSTIKLFYGEDPEFGGGQTDSLGGNSRTSMQFKVGAVIWLTDDARKGLASTSVSSSTSELEFTCSSIRSR